MHQKCQIQVIFFFFDCIFQMLYGKVISIPHYSWGMVSLNLAVMFNSKAKAMLSLHLSRPYIVNALVAQLWIWHKIFCA